MPSSESRAPIRERRVLAVSSGGGHWVQLLRLAPAFAQSDVAYVCVDRAYATQVPGQRFYRVADSTRWNWWSLMLSLIGIAAVLLRERPHVVITTGAAPGYLAIRLGRLIGARTIWIDSVANAEELSLSGQKIGPHADLWLTQWPHLATPAGPKYEGAVL